MKERRSDQVAKVWLTTAVILLVIMALWQPLNGSSAMVWLSLVAGVCTVIFFFSGLLSVILWLIGA